MFRLPSPSSDPKPLPTSLFPTASLISCLGLWVPTLHHEEPQARCACWGRVPGATDPLCPPALQNRHIREGKPLHRFHSSSAHFSITSLINSAGKTHDVKGRMFFCLSHIYLSPSCPLSCLPPSSDSPTCHPPPPLPAPWTQNLTRCCAGFHTLLREGTIFCSDPIPIPLAVAQFPCQRKPNRTVGREGEERGAGRQPAAELLPSLPGTAGDAAGHGAAVRRGEPRR